MKRLSQLFQKIDNSLLVGLSVIFIFFIPLYPKFPLFFIEYTYIAIRADDFFMFFYVLVFLIQIIRKKTTVNRLHLTLFGLFWFSAFLSLISGIIITKTVIHPNIGLMHALRRVEYMIVFLIIYSAIQTKKQTVILFFSYFLSFALVLFYGVGQKFFGFPAIQTMNPEFARGHLLYLTPEARVSSTFAGHYDFAAYIVFTIPLLLGLIVFLRNNFYKTILFILQILSVFLLVLTASRTSFIAYIASSPIFLVISRKFRLTFIVVSLSIFLTLFSQDMIKRWIKTIQIKQILVNERTGEVYVPQKQSSKELPAGSLYIKLDKNEPIKDETILYKQSIIQKEILEEASKSGKTLTSSEAAQIAATLSSEIKPVSGAVYDTSIATRFQIEWPRAIKAFLKNPLLGSGPSSITEATDGDYLRWLGEFGILGTTLFLYILYKLHYPFFLAWIQVKTNSRFFFGSILFATGGLLINAIFIDVFEASKMAYSFWFMLALMTKFLKLSTYEQKKGT